MNKRSIYTGEPLNRWSFLFLKMMSNIEKGAIRIVTPEGKFLNFTGVKDGVKVILRINDWRFCQDIFMKGDIGLGESYISGYWDCDNIDKLIKFGVENYDGFERVIKGSFLTIMFYRFRHMLNRNSEKGSKKNVYAHYDIGNDFYQLWLDPSMTYSSAIFNSADEKLLLAQENKYENILKNLKLNKGDHILEVGCGWGGFMLLVEGLKLQGLLSPRLNMSL